MDIISEYADKAAVQKKFSDSPELERLAFEFCKAFNCKVSETDAFTGYGRYGLRVVVGDGIPAGILYVDPNCARNKDNERVMSYMYKAPHIEKDRSSRNAGRDTRDSVKISSLISAVRKCGEAPDMSRVLKQYKSGIRYAYSAVGGHAPSVGIAVDSADILSMVENCIGVTETIPQTTIESVRKAYESYKHRLNQSLEFEKTQERYAEGCYTVGYMKHDGEEPYYIVLGTYIDKANADNFDEAIKFQGGVKRYTTLRECPEIAMHVPIIRAWAEGQHDVGDNEFGLPRRDRHYPEIDVATGYSGAESFWFLLPKKAP